MPKLPVVSGKDVIKSLSKIGFEHVRTKGTLKSIMRQADLNLEEFLELI